MIHVEEFEAGVIHVMADIQSLKNPMMKKTLKLLHEQFLEAGLNYWHGQYMGKYHWFHYDPKNRDQAWYHVHKMYRKVRLT